MRKTIEPQLWLNDYTVQKVELLVHRLFIWQNKNQYLQEKLCSFLGVSRRTLCAWKHRCWLPTIRECKRIELILPE